MLLFLTQLQSSPGVRICTQGNSSTALHLAAGVCLLSLSRTCCWLSITGLFNWAEVVVLCAVGPAAEQAAAGHAEQLMCALRGVQNLLGSQESVVLFELAQLEQDVKNMGMRAGC